MINSICYKCADGITVVRYALRQLKPELLSIGSSSRIDHHRNTSTVCTTAPPVSNERRIPRVFHSCFINHSFTSSRHLSDTVSIENVIHSVVGPPVIAPKKSLKISSREYVELKQLTSASELISYWKNTNFGIRILPYMLETLHGLIEKEPDLKEEIVTHPLFYKILIKVEQYLETCDNDERSVCNAIQLFVPLIPEDFEATEFAFKVVQKNLQSFYLPHLNWISAVLTDHQETALRRRVLETVKAQIEEIWNEPRSTADLVHILSQIVADTKGDHGKRGDREQLQKIESKILELSDTLTPMQAYKIFFLLVSLRQRQKDVLTALARRLRGPDLNLSVKQMLKLLSGCVALQFYDVDLLTGISSDIQGRYEKTQQLIADVPLFPRYLRTLSHLGWRDPELVNLFVDNWLQYGSTEILSPSESNPKDRSLALLNFCRIFISCANLNCVSEKLKSFVGTNGEQLWSGLEEMVPRCEVPEGTELKEILLTVKYASMYFDLPRSLVESVLSVKWDEQSRVVRECLVAINSYAMCHISEYQGPMLSESDIRDFTDSSRVEISKDQLYNSCLKTFNLLVPDEKFVKQNSVTHLGHKIDFEVLANDAGEMQPINQHVSDSTSLHRVAVLLAGFSKMTLCTPFVLGKVSLTEKSLKTLGYKVIVVTEKDMSVLKTDVQRATFLHDIIASAVKD